MGCFVKVGSPLGFLSFRFFSATLVGGLVGDLLWLLKNPSNNVFIVFIVSFADFLIVMSRFFTCSGISFSGSSSTFSAAISSFKIPIDIFKSAVSLFLSASFLSFG